MSATRRSFAAMLAALTLLTSSALAAPGDVDLGFDPNINGAV
ncbi:MAG: hypothetical protein ABI680_06145 [Chthoniobacteraceae bacterium]